MLSGPRASPIIVFGSQGADFLHAFDSIFVLARYQPQLHSFLSFALHALRSEVQSVAKAPIDDTAAVAAAADDIELLPHLPPFRVFSDLHTLVRHHADTHLADPVINGVLLCLLHAANVVAVHCARAGKLVTPALAETWTALSHPDAHLIGLCTGALSAWASATISEPCEEQCNIYSFMHAAILSMRTAFWIGLRSKAARARLAADSAALGHIDDRWSMLVSTPSGLQHDRIQSLLNDFHNLWKEKHPDFSTRLSVTALALEQVSVSGPPALLQIFARWLQDIDGQLRCTELEIYSPYHNNLLAPEVDNVLHDLASRFNVEARDLQIETKTVWDAARTSPYDEVDPQEYSRRLVESNLTHPVHWDATVAKLVEAEEQQPGVCGRSRAIVNLGPGTTLAADIKKKLDNANNPQDISSTSIYDVPALLRDWAKVLDSEAPLPRSLADPQAEGDEVVIVSMACRFPGDVRTPDQLWTCLETGRETVSEIPKHLFDIDRYHGSGKNQTLARHMHALPPDVTQTMDARLFSMSPKEIEQLDPQHRLTMLCAYEALERAGYSHDANSPSSFDRKRIAICMGASWDDYRENASHNIGSYFITGNIRAFIPGHVSFSLKWEGPSVSVDTLESTAVSAIDWSRRALLAHQCDVALAGAVNVLTQPQIFIAMDKAGILSRSGSNATFSSSLDGKTRGDGCGILLLKRRSTAVRDGDTILATIPAITTATHGFDSGPSAEQSQVLQKLFGNKYGPMIKDLVHIEASGGHTQLAEGKEFESYQQLLARQQHGKISVSSTRPNLGAGEAVSAMASVMKAVLMLQHNAIPRHMGIATESELQQQIAQVCEESSLYIPTSAQLLPTGQKRCILVNSLASTGHQGALLIQGPGASLSTISEKQDKRSAFVFTLSARTSESVEGQRKALLSYLFRDVELRDLSYTLTCRRTHHPFRLTVVAGTKDELIKALRSAVVTETASAAELPDIAFSYENGPGKIDLRILEEFVAIDECLQERRRSVFTEGTPLEAHQVALSTLLINCGVHPSSVTGSIAPAVDLIASGLVDGTLPICKQAQIADPEQTKRLAVARKLAEPTAVSDKSSKLLLQIGSTVALTSSDRAESTPTMLYRQLLTTLADLHQRGYPVTWVELHRPYLYDLEMLHDLPTYSYHLTRHWMEYHDRALIIAQSSDSEADEEDEGIESIDDETDETEEDGCPTQRLLSALVKTTSDEVIYRCDLENGELTPSRIWLWAEIMSESAIEVLSPSGDKTVTLRQFEVHPSLESQIVYATFSTLTQRCTLSTERSGATIASCSINLIAPSEASLRWTTMESLLSDRVSRIVEEGETMGSRMVQRTLNSVSPQLPTQKYIRSASLLDTVAMLSCQLTVSASDYRQTPELVNALVQCGAWFCGTVARGTDRFELCAIRECTLLPQYADLDLRVYVSLLDSDDTSMTLSMLVLDQARIVGEMHAVKYIGVTAVATKAAATVAPTTVTAPPPPVTARVEPIVQAPRSSSSSSAKSKAVTIHEQMLEILAAELGIPAVEIKPNAKFADLGLDSLMSLVCMSTLDTLRLEFPLPQSLFLECDSSGELLTWIRTQVADDVFEPNVAPVLSLSVPPAQDLKVAVADVEVASPSGQSQVDEAMALATSTIETELGVTPGSVAMDANLADLGMDSLMSLLVLGSLSAQLPFELPASLFMDCLTLRDLHTFFSTKIPSDPVATTDPTPRAKAPVLLHAGTNPNAATPLFLLPEGSGLSTVYASFPAIDRPVYALNSPYLTNADAWTGGVEQVAQYYYECIKLIQPVGPYLVGGWSFGGMAAFEIARMLNGPSDRVAGLVMIHSPCPAMYPALPLSFIDWMTSSPGVRELVPAKISDKLIAHFRATVDNLALYRPTRAHAQVKAVYIVPTDPLPGTATEVKDVNETVHWLFRSGHDRGPDGWQELLPSIETALVPHANHFTVVRPPAIESVARIIEAHCTHALSP